MRYVTNSELKLYRRCRRKWWLANYRGLQPKEEKKHGPMVSGTRVHRFLEVYYGLGLAAAQTDFDCTVEYDCAEFPEQAEDITKDCDLAQSMIDGYIEWAAEQGEDEDLELVEPEATIQVMLPGYDDVCLIGKLDQQARRISTGEVLFRDFKTVNDFSRVRLLHIDTQMKHYMLLQRLANPEAKTGLALYTMIRRSKRTARAKPPFFMNVEVRHNDTTLRNYYHQVQAEVADILKMERGIDRDTVDPAHACYPNPTADCSWDCPFFYTCGMLDDGSDAEGLISLTYNAGNHLDRYGSLSAPSDTLSQYSQTDTNGSTHV